MRLSLVFIDNKSFYLGRTLLCLIEEAVIGLSCYVPYFLTKKVRPTAANPMAMLAAPALNLGRSFWTAWGLKVAPRPTFKVEVTCELSNKLVL